MSDVANLLVELNRCGVTLEPRGDALGYFPRRKVSRQLRERLQRQKHEILRLLRGDVATFEWSDPVSISNAEPSNCPAYSVVLTDPDPRTIDALLLSAAGQIPPPAEILLPVPTSRRWRKRIKPFRRVPIRFVDSPLLAARNEFVLLLDGRTIVPRDWAAGALAQMQNATVGAAYSDHELLGAGGRTTYPASITADDLARSGLEAPTILVRRSALVSVYEHGISVGELLRRLARAGWQLTRHDAPVLFRGDEERTYFERQELARETVTLFIPLSGRKHIWPELQKFLERLSWPHNQIHLVLCDTSGDKEFQRTVRAWLAKCDYADTRWFECPVPQTGLADAPRDQQLIAVNEILCRIYNRLRESLSTDYVWILEDDVIPPDDVLERLFRAFDEHVASVCAPYRSRFDGKYLVWSRERAGPPGGLVNNGVHQLPRPLPDRPQVQEIRGSGFGCLLVRAEVLRSHRFCLPPGDVCFDIRFFRELEPRWKRRVDWSCECRHLHNVPRPQGRITKRNLIYHITPFASNDIWLRNVRQLLKRIELFNGRRVIAVATGEGLASPDEIKNAFGPHEIELLTRPNSAHLRENATFLPLLDRVADPDPETATFYAHAKGVAKDVLCSGDPLGSRYWRNAMYRELLDDWPRIAELLNDYAIVGTHRFQHNENQRIFPDGRSESRWHFKGTFFWFRNADTFATTRWRDVWQPTGWGTEAWPGRMFEFEQSACVAYDGIEDHYNPDSYDPQIQDAP